MLYFVECNWECRAPPEFLHSWEIWHSPIQIGWDLLLIRGRESACLHNRTFDNLWEALIGIPFLLWQATVWICQTLGSVQKAYLAGSMTHSLSDVIASPMEVVKATRITLQRRKSVWNPVKVSQVSRRRREEIHLLSKFLQYSFLAPSQNPVESLLMWSL